MNRITLALLSGLLMLGGCKTAPHSEANGTEEFYGNAEEYSAAADTYCGTSSENGARLSAALKQSDRKAVQAMLSKGDAFQIGKGTRTSLVATRVSARTPSLDGDVRAFVIESGSHNGETCWSRKTYFAER